MKVLVFGGSGMLGHQVARQLCGSHDVVTTLRKPPSAEVSAVLAGCRIVTGLDVRVRDAAESLVLAERPEVVVNAVGVVKQRAAASDPIESIEVNSLFPHRLARACGAAGARIIHVSTDCVFSGNKGGYTEADNPDPLDLYDRSKLMGELSESGSLTIRTSIIGLELANYTGLIEWFLRQSGRVPGYRKAIWSGLTSIELARVIERLITGYRELSGVWHVSGQTVSKYDLLGSLAAMLGHHVAVVPDDSVVVDRSLNSEPFRSAVRYSPPSCDTMLLELASAVRERDAKTVA